MKMNIFLLILCLVMFTACNESLENQNMDNVSKPLEEVLTKEYPLKELEQFFYGSNSTAILENREESLYYNEVNKMFPVETMRQNRYSVYKVKEGGYFYVFWDRYYPNVESIIFDEELKPDNMCVQFTTYIKEQRSISKFDSIKTNVTTLKDVVLIDPYTELDVLSSKTCSYSFLNDREMLKIVYKHRTDGRTLSNSIVESVSVVSRTNDNYTACYSSIRSEDLPSM